MNAVELARWADLYVKASPVKAARDASRQAGSAFESTRAKAAAIHAALRAAKCCEDCGVPLDVVVSMERGVGPSCWAKRLKKARAAS